MSITGSPRTAFEVAVAYDVLDRELYLSLLGPEVWRLYRQGGHPAMLLDLYRPPRDTDAFETGITATFMAAVTSAHFRDLTGLAQFIQDRVAPMRRKHVARWREEQAFRYLFLTHMPGASMGDSRLLIVKKLINVMMNSVYNGVQAPYKYRSQMKFIWFEICDVAAGITPVKPVGA